MARVTADRPVRTRNGRKVRILTWTGGSEHYPIVGMVEGNPRPVSWTAEGYHYNNERMRDRLDLDLVNEPVREVLYNYIYADRPYYDVPLTPSYFSAVVKVTKEDDRIVNVELVHEQLADDG